MSFLLALALLGPFAALLWFAAGPTAGAAEHWGYACRGLVGSLWLGLSVAAISTVVGFALAFVVTYYRFAGRAALRKILVLPLLLPPVAVAVIYEELFSGAGPLGDLVRRGLLPALELRSATGFVFAMSVSLYPFAYLLCRAKLEDHGEAPFELGACLGLGRRRAVRRILLPLCVPALALGAGLVFMEAAGDWQTASVLSVDTTSAVLHELWFGREQPRIAARLSLLLVAVLLLCVAAADRWLRPARLRHVLGAPGRPGHGEALRPRRAGPAALLACLLPALLGFAVPLGAVLVLFERTVHKVDLSLLSTGSLHTLVLLAAVGLGGLVLAAGVTYASHARPGAATRFLLLFAALSYLLPAMVFALAVLVLASKGLFFVERYGNTAALGILVYALALRLVCFFVIPIQVGLASLPPRLAELGASLRMKPWSSFRALQLPPLGRFVFVGLLLVLLQTLREIALTVVLHPFGFEPISLKVYSFMRIHMLPESAAWVLVLAVLGMGPLWALEGLSDRGRASERRAGAAARAGL
ncbi:MAG: iron ABC transporter permease [Deltaproteobacteria bacterium]|nr:iron ABC transporter permease [Deltaproteobacteria bacterium]